MGAPGQEQQNIIVIQCENQDQQSQLVYSKKTAFITFRTTCLYICKADKYVSFFLFAFRTVHQSSDKVNQKFTIFTVHQVIQK